MRKFLQFQVMQFLFFSKMAKFSQQAKEGIEKAAITAVKFILHRQKHRKLSLEIHYLLIKHQYLQANTWKAQLLISQK